jgi:hypothetical protein
LLASERLRQVARSSPAFNQSTSKKQQKLMKRRSNDNLAAMAEDQPRSGIFDDANMKLAVQWLMRDCNVMPETVFDQVSGSTRHLMHFVSESMGRDWR